MSGLDVVALRAQFPSAEVGVHFDHASVGPISLRAAAAMQWVIDGYVGRGFDATWRQDVAEVRRRAAQLVGSAPSNIAFSQNTSTGLSIAANGLDWSAGHNVVVPEREFPSNDYPWLNLAWRGVESRAVPAPAGHVRRHRRRDR